MADVVRQRNLAVVPVGAAAQEKDVTCFFGGRLALRTPSSSSATTAATTGAGAATEPSSAMVARSAPLVVLRPLGSCVVALKDYGSNSNTNDSNANANANASFSSSSSSSSSRGASGSGGVATRLARVLSRARAAGLAVRHLKLATARDILWRRRATAAEKKPPLLSETSGVYGDLCAWVGSSSSADEGREERVLLLWLEGEAAALAASAAFQQSSGGSGCEWGDCFLCASDPSEVGELTLAVWGKGKSGGQEGEGGAATALPPCSIGGGGSSSDTRPVTSSELSRVDKCAADASLPQTAVVAFTAAALADGDWLSATIDSLVGASSSSSSSFSSSASSTSSSSASASTSLADRFPFELLGLRLVPRCTSDEARKLAAACIASNSKSPQDSRAAEAALATRPALLLAVRAQGGRRRLAALLQDALQRDAVGLPVYSSSFSSSSKATRSSAASRPPPLPKAMASRTPRHTLSLLAAFFPATYQPLPPARAKKRNGVDAEEGGNDDDDEEEEDEELRVPLSADPNFPAPSRGLKCLPDPSSYASSSSRSHKPPPHPLLSFFPPPVLPMVTTVSVFSPRLVWLNKSITNGAKTSGAAGQRGFGSGGSSGGGGGGGGGCVTSPAVLLRVLKRVEKEEGVLAVASLRLVRLGGGGRTAEKGFWRRCVSDAARKTVEGFEATLTGPERKDGEWAPPLALTPPTQPSDGDDTDDEEGGEKSSDSSSNNNSSSDASPLAVVMEVSGRHGASKWADLLGPPLPTLATLAREQLAKEDARALTKSFRDLSVDVDMRCLRGIMPSTALPPDDLGVYAAQSLAEAKAMRDAVAAALPPSKATATAATAGEEEEEQEEEGNRRPQELWSMVSSTWSSTASSSSVLGGSEVRVLQRETLSLVETGCLVCCPALVAEKGLTALLEQVIHEGFDVVQIKVGCLTPQQAER
jgi:hypothetical protein